MEKVGWLQGKVVLITGGTSGIGQTLTMGMAQEKADVIPTSRTVAKCEKTVAVTPKSFSRGY